jgi:hypothetical protein
MEKHKKVCKYCRRLLPEEFFGVALTTVTKVYRRRKCRDCYRATKQALIEKHYRWISEYKQNCGCSRCGITDPRVLDFHHRDEKTKSFSIGLVRREVGSEKLKKEIKKCIVVCANCHRILHDEMRKVIGSRNGA